MKLVVAPRMLTGGRLEPGWVAVRDGRVVEVGTGRPPDRFGDGGDGGERGDAERIELGSGMLTAGMLDLQVNGGFGVDLASAGPDGWQRLAGCLPAHGVTAFQPTLVTAPLGALRAALDRTPAVRGRLDAAGGARMLGVHLEGPFLSPRRPGVHDPALIVRPTGPALDTLLAGDPATVPTMVTLAPEVDGGLSAVTRLSRAGVVVSVGHSDATAAQVAAAADAGATMVTHVFNAQRGLGHREPGVPGQALDDARFTVGLIPDLVHVSAPVCRLVMTAAAGRVALVTDATAAAGMPPGRYLLGGRAVQVSDDGPPRDAAGTIAGSSLCLDQGVRNLVDAGCDPAGVLDAVTRVPADVLGRTDLGRLAPGAHADLVWWDADLRVRRCWIGGRPVYDSDRPAGADPR